MKKILFILMACCAVQTMCAQPARMRAEQQKRINLTRRTPLPAP